MNGGVWAGGLSMVRVTNKQNLKVSIPPSSSGCGRTCRLGAFLAFSLSSLLCFSTLIPMSSPSQSSIVYTSILGELFFCWLLLLPQLCVSRSHSTILRLFEDEKNRRREKRMKKNFTSIASSPSPWLFPSSIDNSTKDDDKAYARRE